MLLISRMKSFDRPCGSLMACLSRRWSLAVAVDFWGALLAQRFLGDRLTDLAARLLCALVLIISALIQQPAAAMPIAPNTTAYVLPDGSFADLCLTGHDDADGKGGAIGHGCQSCCLVAPADLPAPHAIAAPPLSFAWQASGPANELLLVRMVLRGGTGPRAPPSGFSA